MQCIVVTPERTFCDRPADFVALPLFDGEIGIAPCHTPLIGRLGAGELRILEGSATDRYYVEGGFVEVLNDVVTVLTHRAMRSSEIDAAVAQEQLDSARTRRATLPEAAAAREQAMEQARAQLRLARKS